MYGSVDTSLYGRTLRNNHHFSSEPRSRPAGQLVGRRGVARPNPYPLPPRPPVTPAPVISGGCPDAGTKLYISNLEYGVSNDDIKLLFSIVGPLKRHGIHYDKSGRSKGTAEVVFERQVDATTAIERYNNVNLDGRPIRIELVGVNLVAPLAIPVPDHTCLVNSKPCVNYRRTGARMHASAVERIGTGWDRGNGRACGHGNLRGQGGGSRNRENSRACGHGNLRGQGGGIRNRENSRASGHGNLRGQGGGRHFNSKQKPTTEELDAELERYLMGAPGRAH